MSGPRRLSTGADSGACWLSVVRSSVSGMSQLTSRLRHPVVACVDGLEDLLDGVAELDPGYLATADKADVLVRLTRLVDRVEGLRLRVMATAMDVADVEGAPTVAAWLAPRTRATTRSLHGARAAGPGDGPPLAAGRRRRRPPARCRWRRPR